MVIDYMNVCANGLANKIDHDDHDVDTQGSHGELDLYLVNRVLKDQLIEMK